MLSAVVDKSLRHRGVVAALAVLLGAYGVYALASARYDVFPEFSAPLVSVQTEAPGLAPEQVEQLVTQPLENALNGIPGVEALRSQSIQGLSVITLTFAAGRNTYLDRQAVAERLVGAAAQLPQGAGPPLMEPLTSSTGDLMTIGLSSDKLTLMELRTLADWTLRRRLLAAPGVAKVSVFGGEVRQLQIQVKPNLLVRYDLSIDDIVAAAQRATGVRGAGFIDTPARRVVLQLEGQAVTAAELARTPLVRQSSPNLALDVMLGDVAAIVEAPAPAISAATVMGKPAVVVNVWAQFGANTLEATRAVDAALAELAPGLQAQGVALRSDLFRSAEFVGAAVSNIRRALLLGAALVAVVLLIFLMDFRTAFISCTAIPLSLLAAVGALMYMGGTLNTMTLGGLAIAIGEVVDDAVIDVENILRRLRRNREAAKPRPAMEVVLDASLEVRGAVVYATLAVCLVFVPVLTMSGLAGRLFGPLGFAYIFAILASLLVALTLTPALCLMMLDRETLSSEEPPVAHWLKARYAKLLARVERRPKAVLWAVAAFSALGVGLLPFLDAEFLPQFREGHFIVHMTAAPGASLSESLRLGTQATQAMLAQPFVSTVAQRVGRASADDTYGPNSSEFEVQLKSMRGQDPAKAADLLRKSLEKIEGAEFEVNTFLTERIEETLSGYTSSVVINVFGKDLDALEKAAAEALKVVQGTPGAADARLQAPPGAPQVLVRLRPKDLLRWGLDPVSVLDAVSVAYQGKVAGQVFDAGRVSDLAVVLDPAQRRRPEELGELRVRNPAGTYVPLKWLADIRAGQGRYAVLHEAAQRVQTITSNVSGNDAAAFLAEVKKRLDAKVRLPEGSYLVFAGEAAAQDRSRRDLAAHSLLAGAGIVLLLSIVMSHWRNLLLVLVNLPLALVGGVLVVFVTRNTLSIGCLVGFVTLFGITLRNSLMMISHFEHLVEVEGAAWGPETAIRGACERLTPVVMTALVTAPGLMPLALGASAPGREIEGPMALVILGGLVSSTALNLLVLPTLALRFGRFSAAGAKR